MFFVTDSDPIWLSLPNPSLELMSALMLHFQRLTAAMTLVMPFTWAVLIASSALSDEPNLSPAQVKQVLSRHFSQRDDYRSGDLITRDDTKKVVAALSAAGWNVPQAGKLIEDSLPANSVLVRSLSTKTGKRFMRRVAKERLIYDRLDRVARVSGGPALLRDLPKLPDGYRYAKMDRPRAVPGLLELLPKSGSGKRRTIKNYDKPTSRIYTEKDLADRLEQLRKKP